MAIALSEPDSSDLVVLIPHYNNPAGLKRSLASIAESVVPVDVLVVDDGSETPVQESDLQAIHRRTKVIVSPANEGIEHALNRGLRYIFNQTGYKYVARLDAGDVCVAHRFAVQWEFLGSHADVFLVGSWAVFVDGSDRPLWKFAPPAEHEQIRRSMFLNNMFCHPTIVCRTDLFREMGLYPTDYPRAEDYALFFKAVRRFRTGNIPECLVRTVFSSGGISLRHRRQQLHSRLRIILVHFDFSLWAFYGLARNLALYCLPWSLILKLKRVLHRP